MSDVRTQKPKRTVPFAHLVCGHLRPCDDDVTEGSMIACYSCGLVVRVERVREVSRGGGKR